MQSKLQTVPTLIAVVIIIVGFRLVTQAGQPWPLMQNDGYAVSGGLAILLGGIIIGWLLAKREK